MGITLPEYRDDADWVLVLRPVKSGFGVPACRRMARLVKSVLRCFGFRAVDYWQPHQRPEISLAKTPPAR